MLFSSCLYRKLLQLHHAGILHGDFEPRNIALGRRGVVLLDFSHSLGHHLCSGERKCYELVYARSMLGIEIVGQFNTRMEGTHHHMLHLGVSLVIPLMISIVYITYKCL